MKSRECGSIATFSGTFAFFRPDAADKDIFAHASELPNGHIQRGDRVSYDLAPDRYKPGRMCARAVRLEDESPSVK
jgi:cold shock CspA family protein